LQGKIVAGIVIVSLWLITLVIGKMRVPGEEPEEEHIGEEAMRERLRAELIAEIEAEAKTRS